MKSIHSWDDLKKREATLYNESDTIKLSPDFIWLCEGIYKIETCKSNLMAGTFRKDSRCCHCW